MDVTNPEFIARFSREFLERAPAMLSIDIDRSAALTLIGQLQLALRHPANNGHSADFTRQFVLDLIDRLGTTPLITAGLLAGFDPRSDM